MRTNYDNYLVDIKNLKFTTPEKVVHPKTAIITFFDEKNRKLAVEILGYRENEQWYQMIDDGQPVNMDFCLIRNFSISDYRSMKNMEKKSEVILYNFSARSAFFESKIGTDFSNVSFQGAQICFNENSVTLMNKQENPIGTRIIGPLPKTLKKKKLQKFTNISSGLV